MLKVKVNGEEVKIGAQIPDPIDYLYIQNSPFPKAVDKPTHDLVKAWFKDLVKRCKNKYVMYNGTAIKQDEVKI